MITQEELNEFDKVRIIRTDGLVVFGFKDDTCVPDLVQVLRPDGLTGFAFKDGSDLAKRFPASALSTLYPVAGVPPTKGAKATADKWLIILGLIILGQLILGVFILALATANTLGTK